MHWSKLSSSLSKDQHHTLLFANSLQWEGFAISQGKTTRRFWVLKQPNKAHDKIMILKPHHCDKKLACHDYQIS
jgi:hypothetical protein